MGGKDTLQQDDDAFSSLAVSSEPNLPSIRGRLNLGFENAAQVRTHNRRRYLLSICDEYLAGRQDGDGILTETEIASVSAPPGADGDTLQKAKAHSDCTASSRAGQRKLLQDMFKQMDKNGDEQVTRCLACLSGSPIFCQFLPSRVNLELDLGKEAQAYFQQLGVSPADLAVKIDRSFKAEATP